MVGSPPTLVGEIFGKSNLYHHQINKYRLGPAYTLENQWIFREGPFIHMNGLFTHCEPGLWQPPTNIYYYKYIYIYYTVAVMIVIVSPSWHRSTTVGFFQEIMNNCRLWGKAYPKKIEMQSPQTEHFNFKAYFCCWVCI